MSSLSHRSYDGWASQVAVVVKNPPANAGDIRDTGSIPWLGRSLRRGQSNPLQCSCLENPIDREDWRVTIQRIAKSQTQLKRYGMHIWWLWLLSTFITLVETGGKRLAFSLSQKKKQNKTKQNWVLLTLISSTVLCACPQTNCWLMQPKWGIPFQEFWCWSQCHMS